MNTMSRINAYRPLFEHAEQAEAGARPSRGVSAAFAAVRRRVAALFALWQARRARDAAADASELRAYAQRISRDDPSFAADLFAAADRYERGNGPKHAVCAVEVLGPLRF